MIRVKKHYTQMNKREIDFLINRFKSIPQNRWKFNSYSKKRAEERGVDFAVYRSIWTDGFDLIEYHKHEQKGENRILLRSILTDKDDNQVCAVFNFSTMEVTTVYLNWRTNKHNNLVWEEYDPSIRVKEAFKAC
jgi:uncharacterized DUF497 family protein